MFGDDCLDNTSSSKLADTAAGRGRANPKFDWLRGLGLGLFAIVADLGGRPRLFFGGETGLLSFRELDVDGRDSGTAGACGGLVAGRL